MPMKNASLCTHAVCSALPWHSHPSLFSFRALQCAAFYSRLTPSLLGVGMCHPHPWRNMQERNYLLIFLSVRWCLRVVSQNRSLNAYKASREDPNWMPCRAVLAPPAPVGRSHRQKKRKKKISCGGE